MYKCGEEIHPKICLLEGDDSKVIKLNITREELDMNIKASKLGIAPKVYDYYDDIIEDKIPKYTSIQNRNKIMGNVIPENEIKYIIKRTVQLNMISDRIDGHELRKNEILIFINSIYDRYLTLYNNGINYIDFSYKNILIENKTNRVFIIDYEHLNSSHLLTKDDVIKKLFYRAT